jgi:hypothetical protein
VQRDDGQDASGHERCDRNEERRKVRTDGGHGLPSGDAQFGIAAPGAQQREAAGGQHGEWQGDEEQPKADLGTRRLPDDDLLRHVCRLVLRGLHLPHEERDHEQRCREDEQQFHGGEGAFDRLPKSSYSAKKQDMQSALLRQCACFITRS